MNFLRKRLLIKVYSVCRLHNFLAFICYHTFMSLYTVFCKITKRIHIFNKKSAAESISCKFITHICDAMPVCSERGRSRFSKKLCLGLVQFRTCPQQSRLLFKSTYEFLCKIRIGFLFKHRACNLADKSLRQFRTEFDSIRHCVFCNMLFAIV